MIVKKNNSLISFKAIIILIIIIIIKNLLVKTKLKIVICVIAKQENKYIKEFIYYYKILGFNKIFLFDNNDIDGEQFEKLLTKYIDNNYVEIINFRGFYKPQKLAYKQCYNNNKYHFDWVAFYDVDEFLYLVKHMNIQEFLSLSIFKKCSSILINWKYYGDNNHLFYESKPVLERFQIPFYFPKKSQNSLQSAAKSIIKRGLNISWLHFPHYLKSQTICRPNGKIIKAPYFPYFSPDYSIAFIKHFTTKSTEEYADRLIRGTVNSENTSSTTYMINRLKLYYFLINKITKSKIDFLEKKLNIKLKNFFIKNSS